MEEAYALPNNESTWIELIVNPSSRSDVVVWCKIIDTCSDCSAQLKDVAVCIQEGFVTNPPLFIKTARIANPLSLSFTMSGMHL